MRQVKALFSIFSSLSLSSLFLIQNTWSMPIDVKGRILFDGHHIGQYRKTPDYSSNIQGGSPVPNTNGHSPVNANFQSYIFQLSPQMIINDAVSVFSEISSGYAGGGFLGDSPSYQQNNPNDRGFGDGLYLHNVSANNNSLYFSQAYAEVYADMATFVVGRHTYHWGLGAIYNDGKNLGERFRSTRDGVTAKFKLGSFSVHPFWDKSSLGGSLTSGSQTKAWGASALYDSVEKDMTLGAYWAKRTTNAEDNFYISRITGQEIGATDVKILDLFAKKTWGAYKIALEVPLISGHLGKVYVAPPVDPAQKNTDASYRARAFLVQQNLELNDNWNFNLWVAHISGNAGAGPAYKALYLHPNFQFANILFKYNTQAITDRNQNVFESYMTNSLTLRGGTQFANDTWELDFFVVWAKALEAAKANQISYDHQRATTFLATKAQSDKLGMEFDVNARYNWNSQLKLFSNVGYLFTGDYFAYNVDRQLTKRNVFSFVGGMSVEF